MTNASSKPTPLLHNHLALGAKTTVFAGWEMPLVYTTVQTEHLAVRTKAGLFDISHMGKISVTGPRAARLLDFLFTNSVEDLPVGHARYGFFCNLDGGVLDDLILYRLGDEEFYLVVNAISTPKDLEWLELHKVRWDDYVTINNQTDSHAGIALQGPFARTIAQEILNRLCPSFPLTRISSLRKNQVLKFHIDQEGIILAVTGYTGEDGLEFFGPPGIITKLWEALASHPEVTPAGLAARDTLRLEVCLPLYGHELSESKSPLEAGLEKFVKFEKDYFVGIEVLQKFRLQPLKTKLVPIKMVETGPIPRPGSKVFSAHGEEIGEITSGGFSPMLRTGVGLAYVQTNYAVPWMEVALRLRGGTYRATVCKRPLVSPSSKTFK